MSEQIIDGKRIAREIREELEVEIKSLQKKGIIPGLAVILVGEDPASQIYVGRKEKTANELGFYSLTIRYDATLTQEELLKKIQELNKDPRIHGILVQLPLPPGDRTIPLYLFHQNLKNNQSLPPSRGWSLKRLKFCYFH